jgi:plasmid maintenance system antidote protein VapI
MLMPRELKPDHPSEILLEEFMKPFGPPDAISSPEI